MKKRLGWLVGNGESINLWSEPWLSSSHPLTPICPPTKTNAQLTVSHLLLPSSNEWNIEATREHLPQYEDTIRLLYPSSRKPKDTLVWLPEKSRLYSSKSGYRTLKQSVIPLPHLEFNWFSNIWSLHSSPKIEHFLCRAIVGALPVASNLLNRGITADTSCRLCGSIESEVHALFSCPFAQNVWNSSPICHGSISQSPITNMKQFLDQFRKSTSLPPLGLNLSQLYPWILWHLWTSRNLLIFESRHIIQKTIKNLAGCELSTRESEFNVAASSASYSP